MKVKKLLSGLFIIFLLTILGIVAYFNQAYITHQIDKLRGMYYVYLGDKAYKVYNTKDAILYYNKGLNLYPKHYSAWHNLGNIYVAYEDYYSALEAYKHAFELNPKLMVSRINYGIVASELLGDFDGAIHQYELVIHTKRHLISIPYIYDNTISCMQNKAIAYYNIGVTYRLKALYTTDDWELQRKYINKAIQNYEKSIKIWPEHYDAQYNLGTLYHITGDYERAGRCYCKAIELEPMKYEAHYNLAILLRKLGHYQEAYDEIEKAVTLITALDQNSTLLEYIASVMNDISRNVFQNEDYKSYIKYREMVSKTKTEEQIKKEKEKAKEEKKKKEKKKKERKKIKDREMGETITSDGTTFLNGKVIPSEEAEETIYEEFGSCKSFIYFDPNREEDFRRF